MLVVLWTDALIFLLLAALGGLALYARRQAPWRAAWQRIARAPLALAMLVVLSFYLAIGVLDSLHFHPRLERLPDATAATGAPQHAAQVLSVLDLWLTPLRTRPEKTFSAPLATHAAVQEAVEHEDGTVTRAYPRLLYGGAHLVDPAREHAADLAARCFWGMAQGMLATGAASLLLIGGLAWRRQQAFAVLARTLWHGPSALPWRAAWVTLTLLLILAFTAGELAAHYHLFGTDRVGEDVFYQTLKSIRTGLVIGTLTTLTMLPAALVLGIMAGYFGGWIDDAIQYLYTTLNSIPGVLLIAAAILMLQVYMTQHAEDFASVAERADVRLLFLCLILGVTSWTGLCRLLRGETLKLREAAYVQAAVALGVRHATVIRRHILPNVLHLIIITLTLDFSGLVLAEAVLSYVNIGVDPTTHSWGNMINGARLELAREPIVWWSLTAAFLFMFVLVLAANLFADAVRDAFDPRLRDVM